MVLIVPVPGHCLPFTNVMLHSPQLCNLRKITTKREHSMKHVFPIHQGNYREIPSTYICSHTGRLAVVPSRNCRQM